MHCSKEELKSFQLKSFVMGREDKQCACLIVPNNPLNSVWEGQHFVS